MPTIDHSGHTTFPILNSGMPTFTGLNAGNGDPFGGIGSFIGGQMLGVIFSQVMQFILLMGLGSNSLTFDPSGGGEGGGHAGHGGGGGGGGGGSGSGAFNGGGVVKHGGSHGSGSGGASQGGGHNGHGVNTNGTGGGEGGGGGGPTFTLNGLTRTIGVGDALTLEEAQMIVDQSEGMLTLENGVITGENPDKSGKVHIKVGEALSDGDIHDLHHTVPSSGGEGNSNGHH